MALKVEPEDPDTGIVIEVKYAPTLSGLESACQKAIDQIRERHYQENLPMMEEPISKPMASHFAETMSFNV